MTKNTSGQKIGAQMISATDGSAFTGSVTVYVTGDAGTQGAGSVGSGACTHEGNGYHTYAPAQAETNYDLIAFTFIGTGAIPQTVQVETSASLVSTIWASVADSAGVTTLLSRLSSARAGYLDNLSAGAVALAATFSGITSLKEWLGLLAGKQTGNSTARTELRSSGAGSGTYDETTDSQEATRDALGTAQTGDAYARLGAPAGASVSADVAAVKSDTGTLVTRITSTLFTGITSLAQWLGAMAGKQTSDATAQTEMRATGAGSGTFSSTVDSQQALRDRGDAAWTTATGFSTHSAADAATAVWAAGTRTLTSISGLGIALASTLTKYVQLIVRKDAAIATTTRPS